MYALQSALPDAHCNEETFKNMFINVMKDVEACKLAYFKATATVEGLISYLRSSLAIESTVKHAVALDAHLIDRKFRDQRGSFQIGKETSFIVCNKKGYWSTNHSKEERLTAPSRNKHVCQLAASITEDDEQVRSSTHNDADDGADEQYIDGLEDLSGIAHAVYVVTDVEVDL